MELHERIKAWREARGLKVMDVAAKLGLTSNAVHFWERDRADPNATLPSRKHLDELLKIYGLTIAQFWGRIPKGKRAA